ncbi:MAG: biotin--[acetyl-CoA-carboxylase] ligase [Ilumatobacteraceae bacterium]
MNASDRAPTRPWPPGWTVRHVASTGSTNTDLAAAAPSMPDRSVLVAGHQTAGRGRLDRRWEAPPGTNLLASMLFHDVPDRPVELTQRVGLAALATTAELANLPAVLKWPNDVLVGEAKLAGILAQRVASGSVVVGIGMNVRWAPPGAARLGEHLAPLDVLAVLLAAFDALPADIEPGYRAALVTLGRRVRVERPTGVLDGTAVDVDAAGRLVVVDAGAVTHHLDVGDVIHVR